MTASASYWRTAINYGPNLRLKARAGSWSLRALRLQSDCGPRPPFPFPPLPFHSPSPCLPSPDNEGGVAGDMTSPHNGVCGGALAANEIPCILVEI